MNDKTKYKHLTPMTPEQRLAGQLRRQERILEWEKLDLRQDWVDERFMRSIISAAGIGPPIRAEPACAPRLRTFLKRAGMMLPDIVEAVGVGPEEFLEKNPRLPLWAAISIVLESTGKYDNKPFSESTDGH